MTPDDIIKNAERLGGMSPEAVRNLVVIGSIVIALLVVYSAYLVTKSKTTKEERKSAMELNESNAFIIAINNLTDTLSRQYERGDKAETLVASLADTSSKFADQIQKTLITLLETLNKVTDMLGGMTTMNNGIAQTQEQLGQIEQTLRSLVATVRDLYETQQVKAEAEAATNARLNALEAKFDSIIKAIEANNPKE